MSQHRDLQARRRPPTATPPTAGATPPPPEVEGGQAPPVAQAPAAPAAAPPEAITPATLPPEMLAALAAGAAQRQQAAAVQAPPPGGVHIPPNQTGVMDLFMRVVDSQRQTTQRFYLLIVPEDDHPRCEEFDTVAALVTAIRRYADTYSCLFPFLGTRLPITKGPFRFLRTPFGGNIPLFDMIDENAPEEEHGWMGKTPLPDIHHGVPVSLPDDEPTETAPAEDPIPAEVVSQPIPAGGIIAEEGMPFPHGGGIPE